MSGELLTTLPGAEARALTALAAGSSPSREAVGRGAPGADGPGPDETATAGSGAARRWPAGAIILAGERLAEVPGALAAAYLGGGDRRPAGLDAPPGRRARRGRGRRPAGAAAHRPPGRRPRGPRRSGPGLGQGLAARHAGPRHRGDARGRAAGELGALVIAGVDPADLPDPAAALRAIEMAPFVVSLELRASAVTDRADVVFPVAAVAEKAGTFVNWEGRGGSFDAALRVPELRTDLYVLGAIADQMDVHLGLPDAAAARAELAALGTWRGDPPGAPRGQQR